ncbi:MAG: NAD+ synthase [Alphaproteobacteria bacterium]|nr:NAD+ synthase [Alphaproteobacteria bacterium]
MPKGLSLALAQLNPAVGDIKGNADKLRTLRKKAASQGAQLLMLSELYITGYPPEDLILKSSFQNAVREEVEALALETADGGPAILLGAPWIENDRLYNASLLLSGGKIAVKTFKHDLPNYGPFDEKRVFAAGPLPEPIEFQGLKLGIMICEDMWTPAAAAHLKKRGAQILLVLNGSPYEFNKQNKRQSLAQARVQETGLALVYLNQVGGQDELIFDGESFVLDTQGQCMAQAEAWSEDFLLTQWNEKAGILTPEKEKIRDIPQDESAVYHALMHGLRDYVGKNGFPGVVLGLSGGIDSALVAALAVDALGADKLWSVMLPSPYTAQESLDDAAVLAKTLKCRFDTIPITAVMKTFEQTLTGVFAGRAVDTTEENIQSRCRGLILMALSNKFGPMVLATGNKSELSVGYATLYGDMCGGFAVLKDVYKTQVYKLARWRNAQKPDSALGPAGKIIPENILTRAPTAELRSGQTDQDSLPPYEVLDDILECLIEKDMGLQDIVKRGHDVATVKRVWGMLDRAEYKRRQAPPGVKITSRYLGKDRRYPITNKYRET